MHPDELCRQVLEQRAQLGLTHDGDADRVLLCDEHGTLIDGDDILAITGLDLLPQGALPEKTVVTTVMSNAGLDRAFAAAGGQVVRTPVGDRYVIDEMLRRNCRLGGEQSGHIVFREHGTTGDGLVAALQVLRIMKTRNALLSQLVHCWRRFPQRLTNIPVREKVPFDQLPAVHALVSRAETELQATGGRLFLRYSGTECKARLLAEAPDADLVAKWSALIGDALREQLGA